ncbi:hypothetical protein F8M41_001928 [Gigaspora margarita]|uniref:Uncharacterized protein n=1 Tax=Gigaspora margarita TaxID=4874 RepID=A0A8H4AYT5_GIGMA|nr:hypothetical protein F8M41_001928 [Gigaspora margarita]
MLVTKKELELSRMNEAISWHKKSDDNNNEKGMFNIGCCYQIGIDNKSKKASNAGFYQNEISLKKVYKDQKKGINNLLRQIDDNLSKNKSKEVITKKEKTPQAKVVLKSNVEIVKDKC